MSEREYFNRVLKDLQRLKKQVLSLDSKKRKEFGYLSVDLPKPISHTGRPLSADVFIESLSFITSTTVLFQSILDKSNGLTSSCAIDLIEHCPYPLPETKVKRGRKPLGDKTQERLLQKGFNEAQKDTDIGMRTWIKKSQETSQQIGDAARKIIDSGEPMNFVHITEDGTVTYEMDPDRQRAYLGSKNTINNHSAESILRALTKANQKSRKNTPSKNK
jgi:hypothetical protein